MADRGAFLDKQKRPEVIKKPDEPDRGPGDDRHPSTPKAHKTGPMGEETVSADPTGQKKQSKNSFLKTIASRMKATAKLGTEKQNGAIREAILVEAVPNVKKEKYSWGNMVTIHHGHHFTVPVHPEHQRAIARLTDGGIHSFRDETKQRWTAHRDHDMVHFKSRDGSMKTYAGLHHFTESVDEAAKSMYWHMAQENKAKKMAARIAAKAEHKLHMIHRRASEKAAKKVHTDKLHSMIAQHVQREVAETTPDSDPYESIHHHVHRTLGVPHNKVHAHIDAAVKKHLGHRNYHSFVDSMAREWHHSDQSLRGHALPENYRIAALKGMGAEKKGDVHVKVGRGADYYHPENGDKHSGMFTHVGKDSYRIKDDRTKKVHTFKYFNHDEYKKMVEEVAMAAGAAGDPAAVRDPSANYSAQKKRLGSIKKTSMARRKVPL